MLFAITWGTIVIWVFICLFTSLIIGTIVYNAILLFSGRSESNDVQKPEFGWSDRHKGET